VIGSVDIITHNKLTHSLTLTVFHFILNNDHLQTQQNYGYYYMLDFTLSQKHTNQFNARFPVKPVHQPTSSFIPFLQLFWNRTSAKLNQAVHYCCHPRVSLSWFTPKEQG